VHVEKQDYNYCLTVLVIFVCILKFWCSALFWDTEKRLAQEASICQCIKSKRFQCLYVVHAHWQYYWHMLWDYFCFM